MRQVSRLADLLARLCDGLAAVAVAVLVSAMLAQVFFRYVLSSSLVWADEVAILGMIWAVLLGAVGVTRRSQHIHVTVVYAALPLPLRIATILAGRLITLAAFLAIAWVAWDVLAHGFHRRSTVTGLSFWWGKLAFFVGGFLMSVMTGVVLAEEVRAAITGRTGRFADPGQPPD